MNDDQETGPFPSQVVPAADVMPSKARRPWVEPTVRKLAVEETAFSPGRANDGQRTYPDCTRS